MILSVAQAVQPAITPLVRLLGWALLHFIWEGAAIALLLSLTLFLSRSRSSNLRYTAACFALLIMAACPFATALYLAPNLATPQTNVSVPIQPPSPVPNNSYILPIEHSARHAESKTTSSN